VSDFLVNVVRRGAGLAPAVRPRPHEEPIPAAPLPAELEEERVPAPPPIHPETSAGVERPSGERSRGEIGRAAGPGPAGRLPLEGRPVDPLISPPTPRPSAMPADARSASAPVAVRAPAAPDPAPRLVRAAEGEPPPSQPDRLARTLTGPEHGDHTEATAAPARDARRATGRGEESDVAEEPHPSVERGARGTERSIQEPVPPIAPAPGPPPITLPAPQAAESAGRQIVVRIGRIEVSAPPAPAPVPPPARRTPRGFSEQAVARGHGGRRWY